MSQNELSYTPSADYLICTGDHLPQDATGHSLVLRTKDGRVYDLADVWAVKGLFATNIMTGNGVIVCPCGRKGYQDG
jgi:hypothetical protein